MTSIEKSAILSRSDLKLRSDLTADRDLTLAGALSQIELLTDRLDRSSGMDQALVELSRQLRAHTPDAHPDAVLELWGLVEQVLEKYLASVLLTSGAEDLRHILRDQEDRARRRLVAALAYRLGRSRDAAGIVMWFLTPRPQLGDRTPAAVLDAERAEAARLLLPLAGGSEMEASRI